MSNTLKMTNIGIFLDYLQERLEEKHVGRKKSKDPYEQWNFAEQIKLLEEVRVAYKDKIINQ